MHVSNAGIMGAQPKLAPTDVGLRGGREMVNSTNRGFAQGHPLAGYTVAAADVGQLRRLREASHICTARKMRTLCIRRTARSTLNQL